MKNKKTFTSIYKGVRNFLTSEDAAEMAYMSVAVTFYVLLGIIIIVAAVVIAIPAIICTIIYLAFLGVKKFTKWIWFAIPFNKAKRIKTKKNPKHEG